MLFGGEPGKSVGLSCFQSPKGRFILVLVICMGLLALLWPSGQEKAAQPVSTTAAAELYASGKGGQISLQLEKILCRIDGAGAVQVNVMLASEGSREFAHNTRAERRDTDDQGMNKRVLEESTVHDLAVSAGNPLLVEEKTPEILGVLVVASGAGNVAVKEQLCTATATLLNIPLHRVMVVAGRGGRNYGDG